MTAKAAASALEVSCDWALDWIPEFAEPYLRGYAPCRERGASLAGYRFLAPGSQLSRPGPARSKAIRASRPDVARSRRGTPSVGFFVGYLLRLGVRPGAVSLLHFAPPECLVFCFVEPVGGALHRRLVAEPAGLARRTAEYIGWLTHRHPRFEFFPDQPMALVRHTSMREWPREKVEHLSRNFFTETLAWLVRSALVRRLSSGQIAARVSAGTPSCRAAI